MVNWEHNLRSLAVAQPEALAAWLAEDAAKIKFCLLLIAVGGGLYGAALGLWRAPLQGLYVAIKFPLLLGLTALGNGLINGMLAQLLGAPITLRQSLLAVLMSFALLAAVLGAFTPLILFLLWHLPAHGGLGEGVAHALYLIANTALIAMAGVLANRQLYRLLAQVCASPAQAMQILTAWLSVNLFLGAQLAWNLRPFFGTPGLPVQFLREDPFDGNFYEALFYLVLRLLGEYQ